MNKMLGLAVGLATGLLASSAGAVSVVSSVTVAPSPLAFNTPQDAPRTRVITVTNNSGGSISFGASTVSGTDAGDVAIGSDTCANHTIQNGRTCHVHVTVTATEPVGAYESATVSINSSGGSSLATDVISARVINGPFVVTAQGQTITIKNNTANAAGMDYSTFGNLSVTGGTCTDYLQAHTTCTLVVTLTPPDNGDGIQIQISPFGGSSQYFNLSF